MNDPMLVQRSLLDGTTQSSRGVFMGGGSPESSRSHSSGPAALIDYLGQLQLTGGDHDGQLFTVLPWQRQFIEGLFAGDQDGALSVGRGNGKSAFVGAIACAVVDPDGPLHRARSEVVCVAASFEQGRIIYEDTLGFLRSRYDLENRAVWRKQDSGNRAVLEYRPTGARVRCLGGHPGRAHGLRPALALLDEPAQWDPAKADRMYQALRTAVGKIPGARLVALGTRPEDTGHWFARMMNSGSGAVYVQVHAAGKRDDPFTEATIRKANPSLDHLPSLRRRIRMEAQDAGQDPDALAAFKALRLNMGVADTDRSVLVDIDTWKRAEALETPEAAGGYVLGIDLGHNDAMSACAGYWPTGRLDAFAAFPEVPSLQERGVADGVAERYERMAERGELLQLGHRVTDLAGLLVEVRSRWGIPAAIGCDMWREAELRQALGQVGFPVVPLILRHNGYRHGGQDVRTFRTALLRDRVRPLESLLLRSAIGEARTISDPSGSHKLAKNTEGGRRKRAKDDAAAASILAVAVGSRLFGADDAAPARKARSVVL